MNAHSHHEISPPPHIRCSGRRPFPGKQKGAVLFIGLVMIILMTLLGMTAMQTSLLEERMSGGFLIQHQSFEATESRLKDARLALNADVATSGPLASSPDAELNPDLTFPWNEWMTGDPEPESTTYHRWSPTQAAILGTPNLKYFLITAVDQDPGPNGGDAKTAVQSIFIY